MKGDFTRLTFKRRKRYSGVRMQQGRVQLDADWNEQHDISTYFHRSALEDSLGPAGGPLGGAGFGLSVVGNNLRLGAGRYYVGGLLCENDADVLYTAQPDLNGLVSLPGEDGLYLAYLDVWERHLSHLEDPALTDSRLGPALREVALRGPDTTTRTRVVWQARLARLDPDPAAALSCLDWAPPAGMGTGLLAARAEPSPTSQDPCEVPPGAGYRGLENQLYRVEIHVGGPFAQASFKWSRENGSVLFAVSRYEYDATNSRTTALLAQTPRDARLGLAPGNWVELLDEHVSLSQHDPALLPPEKLFKVVTVEALEAADGSSALKVVLDGLPSAPFQARSLAPDYALLRPLLRRWDHGEANGPLRDGAVPLKAGWLELEEGVQVNFRQQGNPAFQAGDYWVVPARVETGDVEWPQSGTPAVPVHQEAEGARHRYAPLGLLRRQGGTWGLAGDAADCRSVFPPLTRLLQLYYVGGDGQEAMPGQPVLAPLQVRVANGAAAVAGARVRFRVLGGGGTLGVTGHVLTDANGLAQTAWTLGSAGVQRARAELLDPKGDPLPNQIVDFGADLSVAANVAYTPGCADLQNARTVQEALDLLCRRPSGGGCEVTVGEGGEFATLEQALKALLERGERDLCLCLMDGEHRVGALEVREAVHLKIRGCGRGTRVRVEGGLRFEGLRGLTLRDFELEVLPDADNGTSRLQFVRCGELSLEGCAVAGSVQTGGVSGSLLLVVGPDRVRLRDNVLEARTERRAEVLLKVFEGFTVLEELFKDLSPGRFRRAAPKAAEAVSALPSQAKTQLAAAIAERLTPFNKVLSLGETVAYTKLILQLSAQSPDPNITADHLEDIRKASVRAVAGTALVLLNPGGETLPQTILTLDEDDFVLLEANEITGAVSLYGFPGESVPNADALKRLEALLKENQLLMLGLMGHFQLRGNRLTRLAVSEAMVQALIQATQDGEGRRVFYNLFGSCLLSDNLFDSGRSLLVSQHAALGTNVFSFTADPPPPTTGTAGPLPQLAGTAVSRSASYVGNHGRGQTRTLWQDISRTRLPGAEQVLNLEFEIV
ncbi:hypothetical protein Mterra_02666 [Calidithermus terrae]|uniref:Uncharacterized protein n=1 Tax=Calidithermus terrae TaxID=1408545 RepID=A0A399ECQ8_9DEIN|nr:DUF6519 domain-containing protein [Calidithermus terrae]RIH82434.1 hypothetical protein Mterra_02666 [Calidithermus terrae]